MPSNQPGGFVSYGQMYNLNKPELDRMKAEAEARWQEADTSDRGATRALAETQRAGTVNLDKPGGGKASPGSYADYTRLRGTAQAQWKAYKQAQKNAVRSTFERAAVRDRASGDTENWASMEQGANAAIDSARATAESDRAGVAQRNEQYSNASDAWGQADAARARAEALKQRANAMFRTPGMDPNRAQELRREYEAAEREAQTALQRAKGLAPTRPQTTLNSPGQGVRTTPGTASYQSNSYTSAAKAARDRANNLAQQRQSMATSGKFDPRTFVDLHQEAEAAEREAADLERQGTQGGY